MHNGTVWNYSMTKFHFLPLIFLSPVWTSSYLNKMISKIKESDLSSEKKLSRKAEATKFVEIIKTEWNAQLKLYDLDHNLINQIEANWKEPLNIALHKYHYQKERG